jgi:hypothetical protein
MALATLVAAITGDNTDSADILAVDAAPDKEVIG